MTEKACEERCRRRDKGKACKACKRQQAPQAAAAYIAEKLLPHCGQVKLLRSSDKTTLYLNVHQDLSMEVFADGLDGDGYMSIKLWGREFTHAHPTGREMLEMLVPFLKGEGVLVCERGLGWDGCEFVTAAELRADWQKRTQRPKVWIADLRGTWEKEEYAQHIRAGEEKK